MKCLSHRKPRRELYNKLVKEEVRTLNFEKEEILLQYFSSDNIEGSSKSNQQFEYQKKVPEQPSELYETADDFKYGAAVFEALQTELGQDPGDSYLDMVPAEEVLVCGLMWDKTEAPRKITLEDVLAESGMHIIDLGEMQEFGDYDFE